jgi:thiol:disulfide interchange protein
MREEVNRGRICAMTISRALLALGVIGMLAGVHPAVVRAQTPPPAKDVVAAAVARAHAERKAVLIEFGASWCTWCRSFEAFVKSDDAGPVLARHFIIINLTVRERDEKRALEHPGGNALMDEWGGAMSGLPFYVFMDDTGRKVADSNAMPDASNIGFPAVPDEIRAFLGLMERAAPTLSTAERGTLESYLTRVMPDASTR